MSMLSLICKIFVGAVAVFVLLTHFPILRKLRWFIFGGLIVAYGVVLLNGFGVFEIQVDDLKNWLAEFDYPALCYYIWEDNFLISLASFYASFFGGNLINHIWSGKRAASSNPVPGEVENHSVFEKLDWKKIFFSIVMIIIAMIACITRIEYLNSAEMPDLLGETFSDARQMLKAAGFINTPLRAEDGNEKGVVVAQTYEAGTILPKDAQEFVVTMSGTDEDNEPGNSISEQITVYDLFEKYESILCPDTYQVYQSDSSEGIEFQLYYPAGLFCTAQEETQGKFTGVRFEGIDSHDDLVIWVGYQLSESLDSMVLLSAYAISVLEYYADIGLEEIGEPTGNTRVLTGYTGDADLIYLLLAARDNILYVLFISCYDEKVDPKDISASDDGHFCAFYSNKEYAEVLEEKHKIFAYMTEAVYHRCSFSGATSDLMSYEEFVMG